MISECLLHLERQPAAVLIKEYCMCRTRTEDEVARMLASSGFAGSPLSRFLEEQTLRVGYLRARVIERLIAAPTPDIITLASAMNIETMTTHMDIMPYRWWPPAAVKMAAEYPHELALARSTDIGDAWAIGCELNSKNYCNAIAVCNPRAIYLLSRGLVGRPEQQPALFLAYKLGSLDAAVEWYTAFDMRAALVSIGRHPRARFAYLQKYYVGLDGKTLAELEELMELVNRGVCEAAELVGRELLRRGRNEEAARWFGRTFEVWAKHACVKPAAFGPFTVSHDGEFICVRAVGEIYTQGDIRRLRCHLVNAQQIKIAARGAMRDHLMEHLRFIPHIE